MIPNISGGSSFFGAGLYYLHDKKAPGETECYTSERVAWTHTLNCVSDDPNFALQEMLTTYNMQPLLKEWAGRSPSGSRPEDVVKTISLSWHPTQDPSQQQMIEAAESYLKFMKWHEHQALLVAHNDTDHSHVHIILNKIHPIEGVLLKDYQEEVNSQRWADAYDKEHGQIFCKARDAKYGRGEELESTNVPRKVWQSWKDLAVDLDGQTQQQQALDAAEWDLLKQSQRDERDAYQEETKRLIRQARYDVYQEVRQEFKAEWRDWFKLQQQDGHDAKVVEDQRQDILQRQAEATKERQREAIAELRGDRRDDYQELLTRHREERGELTDDQAAGIRRYDLLNRAYPAEPAGQAQRSDNDNSQAQGAREPFIVLNDGPPVASPALAAREDESPMEESRTDGGAVVPPRKDAVSGVVDGLLSLFDKATDSLTGGPPEPPSDPFAKMRANREAYEATQEANRQAGREHAAEWEAAREADWEEWERERARGRDR